MCGRLIVRDAETREPVIAEDLLEEIDFLTALNRAQLEVAAGETVSEEEARAYFRARFGEF